MKTTRLIAFTIALLFARSGHAIEIFLTGPTSVSVNSQFEIGFWIDISNDPIIGGGVDVFYDFTLVDYQGFSFNPGLVLDPLLSFGPTDNDAGTLSFLTFGDFDGLASNSPLQIGTLTFDALALGLADFGLDPFTPAGWVSDTFPHPEIDPNLIDAFGWSVNIVAQVPEPPILVLLAGGVLLMAGLGRKHR